MLRTIALILSLATTSIAYSQSWTAEQLSSANTAATVSYLKPEEKETIKFINLARLYPADFARIEVANYGGPAKYGGYVQNSSYKKSLIRELNQAKSIPALQFDSTLQADATCFAKEIGPKGYVGHDRKSCAPSNYAENVSSGMDTGRDIALQWLIDHDVAGEGHRKNSLNPSYKKIGISIQPHTAYQTCAVAELIW